MFRHIHERLLPRRLLNAIRVFTGERGTLSRPLLMEKPEGSRILVLAPHPDDDVMGCGGVVHKHHLAGDSIVAVYLTDGRKGGSGEEPEDQVARLRQEEARKAADILGIDRLVFLDNEDETLSHAPETVQRLAAVLEEARPDVVYVPFLLDGHPDHRAANEILAGAMKTYRDFTIYGYEIWTLLVPNCSVDISDVLEVKKSALEQFETQTSRFDLVDAFVGLARYRAVMHFHAVTHVECFYRCSPGKFLRLLDRVR